MAEKMVASPAAVTKPAQSRSLSRVEVERIKVEVDRRISDRMGRLEEWRRRSMTANTIWG